MISKLHLNNHYYQYFRWHARPWCVVDLFIFWESSEDLVDPLVRANLASNLLFLKSSTEAALATFRWARWRLDCMIIRLEWFHCTELELQRVRGVVIGCRTSFLFTFFRRSGDLALWYVDKYYVAWSSHDAISKRKLSILGCSPP